MNNYGTYAWMRADLLRMWYIQPERGATSPSREITRLSREIFYVYLGKN